MAMKSFKFNKSNLGSLVSSGVPVTVRDTEVTGLRFKTGVKRSVFSFEKRICGRKGAPITFTIGAFPAVTIDDARRESRRLANLCEQGIDPRKQKKAAETCALLLQTAVDKFYQVKVNSIKSKRVSPNALSANTSRPSITTSRPSGSGRTLPPLHRICS